MSSCENDPKSSYLSMDDIPSTITIKERAYEDTVVQFTAGSCFDDKPKLASKNFTWDKTGKTYVRIWARGSCLSGLLQTYAIEPQYIMPNATGFENKACCLLMPRSFLIHAVYKDIHSAISACGFAWSKHNGAWIKKMTRDTYRKEILSIFRKTPPRVIRTGSTMIKDTKQIKKDILKEQETTDRQREHFETVFKQKQEDLLYRCYRAQSDPVYQRASYEYGQRIKRMAQYGDYNYPDPPKLPRYH